MKKRALSSTDARLLIGIFALIAVFAIGAAIAFISAGGAAAWCSADDKFVSVCLRNWANAVGNSIAAGIAGLAAYFALRQSREARRQADLASLPALEQRILAAQRLTAIAHKLKNPVSDLKKAINDFCAATEFRAKAVAAMNIQINVTKILEGHSMIEEIDRSHMHTIGFGAPFDALENGVSLAKMVMSLIEPITDNMPPYVGQIPTLDAYEGVVDQFNSRTDYIRNMADILDVTSAGIEDAIDFFTAALPGLAERRDRILRS